MIYDCVPFFNELDMLEIRLNVLKDVVDRFVILEANTTHSGKPKDRVITDEVLHDRFKGFPILYAQVDSSAPMDSWERERYQRDWLVGVIENIMPDDTLVISDVDELPNPEIVKEELTCRIVEDLYYFYLNTSAEQDWWKGTYMIKGREAKSRVSLTDLRLHGHFNEIKGGWHWSSLGGKEKVQTKLESFAHTEFDNEESIRTVLSYHNSLRSIHGEPLTVVPMDDRYPKYILDNQDRFKHLIWT